MTLEAQKLPRVVRRAVGYMRFTRDGIGATATSLFLVDGAMLRGLVGDWDWTRTSFPSAIADWPTVRESLATGELASLSATHAHASERGWFEQRGIARTVCVPLGSGANALGVIFVDFEGDAPVTPDESSRLRELGARCTRALRRSHALLDDVPHSVSGSMR